MQLEIRNAVERDRLVYNAFGFAAGALIAIIFFRRLSFMITGAGPPPIAIVLALSALGCLDFRFNMFLNVMTPLIMVISCSDGMQLTFAARNRLLQAKEDCTPQCRTIVIVDRTRKRAEAVATDLRCGSPLCPKTTVVEGDYEDFANSELVMITAGINEKAGGAIDRSDPRAGCGYSIPTPRSIATSFRAFCGRRLACRAPAPSSTACASASTWPSISMSMPTR